LISLASIASLGIPTRLGMPNAPDASAARP
jgi:hypothetical protein